MSARRMMTTAGAMCALALLIGCSAKEEEAAKPAGVDPQTFTDSLFAVMSSDRAVYTQKVVNRLQNDEKVIKASEHFEDDKALPLPAQMFRFGAEMVAEKTDKFSYQLLSLFPINKQNAPKTDVEKQGLEYIAANPGKNYYGDEELGGKKYFTAVYADKAVAPACVTCHNDHKDTPKKDFKIGDTMGGVVIRVPMS
jgi:hypothetical protein